MKTVSFKQNEKSMLIIFCGLASTLKTYISARLSAKLGYAYLPTRSIGELKDGAETHILEESRKKRYEAFSKVVDAAFSLGANVIVDGGFSTFDTRQIILRGKKPEFVILIHCVSDNEVKLNRLKVKASDSSDYERFSAKRILIFLKKNNDELYEENPEIELKQKMVLALLKVDTTKNKLSWSGKPPKVLAKKISTFIKGFLKEYHKTTSEGQTNQLASHFDDIAATYDNSTEWRMDKKILQSLQENDIPGNSRILDIGTGTGLASAWYTKKGHDVVGVDISPQMLQKASERLTFVLLANATKLPFINNYFDVAIVRQCLHYVEPACLLTEAQRTIKKGGLIAVSGAVCPNEKTKNFWREFKNATQPLRLEVFTIEDILRLLKESGFKIKKQTNHSILRKETLSSIEKRSIPVTGGTRYFLENMNKLTSKLFPELEFNFNSGVLTYKQYWITIWAIKI